MTILDQYVKSVPHPQNALDIFKGEWSSKLPAPYDELTGKIPLFEDARIIWAEEQLGGFKECDILELGPLEGGHSYMLEKSGASSILSIEANTRAYIKCLITKEILKMKRAHFQLGDFISYLKQTQETYDVCIASGVLYHMQNPAELIYLISKVSQKVMIWTHYYDQEVIQKNSNLPKEKFSNTAEMSDYQGFKHALYRHNYHAALEWSGFCGGGDEFSMWMPKQDILSCLKHFGFNDLKIAFDAPNHPNGPSFCIAASQ
jgi:hypothetical protein